MQQTLRNMCVTVLGCRHAVMEAVHAMGERDCRLWPNWYQQTNAPGGDVAVTGSHYVIDTSSHGASSQDRDATDTGSHYVIDTGSHGASSLQTAEQNHETLVDRNCNTENSGNYNSSSSVRNGNSESCLQTITAHKSRDAAGYDSFVHDSSGNGNRESCAQAVAPERIGADAAAAAAADIGSFTCMSPIGQSKRRRFSQDCKMAEIKLPSAALATHPGVGALSSAVLIAHPGVGALPVAAMISHPGEDATKASPVPPRPGVGPLPSAVLTAHPGVGALPAAAMSSHPGVDPRPGTAAPRPGVDVGTHPGVDGVARSDAACEKPYLCTGYDCYVVRVSLVNYPTRVRWPTRIKYPAWIKYDVASLSLWLKSADLTRHAKNLNTPKRKLSLDYLCIRFILVNLMETPVDE